jgi:hypothetical protein
VARLPESCVASPIRLESRGSESRPSYHANENFQLSKKKTTAQNFRSEKLTRPSCGMGSVQLSLSPIARPATPKFLRLSIADDHGTVGCCRSGVLFSILRAPSPLISPDGDSAAPTGACPIDGDPGVTP